MPGPSNSRPAASSSPDGDPHGRADDALLEAAARRVADLRLDVPAADPEVDALAAAVSGTLTAAYGERVDRALRALADEPDVVRSVVARHSGGGGNSGPWPGAQRAFRVEGERSRSRRTRDATGAAPPELVALVERGLHELLPALHEELVLLVAERRALPETPDLPAAAAVAARAVAAADAPLEAAVAAALTSPGDVMSETPQDPQDPQTQTPENAGAPREGGPGPSRAGGRAPGRKPASPQEGRPRPSSPPASPPEHEPMTAELGEQGGHQEHQEEVGADAGTSGPPPTPLWKASARIGDEHATAPCVSMDTPLAPLLALPAPRHRSDSDALRVATTVLYLQSVGLHVIAAADAAARRFRQDRLTLLPETDDRLVALACWEPALPGATERVGALSTSIFGERVTSRFGRVVSVLADTEGTDDGLDLLAARVVAEVAGLRVLVRLAVTPWHRVEARKLSSTYADARRLLEQFGDEDVWDVLALVLPEQFDAVVEETLRWESLSRVLTLLVSDDREDLRAAAAAATQLRGGLVLR